MGFLGISGGFVLNNPVPETVARHGLRAIKGVFGVLFQLPGNFSKWLSIPTGINQVPIKYFSATEKNHKNPKNPFFAIQWAANGSNTTK
jgi:hypothetical protein